MILRILDSFTLKDRNKKLVMDIEKNYLYCTEIDYLK